MNVDYAKLARLRVRSDIEAAHAQGLAELRGHALQSHQTNRAEVLNRARWPADDPRRALPFADMAALPADTLQAAGLDAVTLRRYARAESELAAYSEQQAAHAARFAPLRALVRRLEVWAGDTTTMQGVV